jgi:hypothetical protein
MNLDFKEVMSTRTDEELINIVTVFRNDYQPLAVEAAEEELKKRNIDKNNIEDVKVDWASKIEEKDENDSMKVTLLTRLIHFIVDTLAFFLLTIVLAYILGLFIHSVSQNIITIFGFLIYVIGFFVYYVFMETKYQKTIGKFITKTKVINKNGTKPELGDIVRRTFC